MHVKHGARNGLTFSKWFVKHYEMRLVRVFKPLEPCLEPALNCVDTCVNVIEICLVEWFGIV